MFVIIYLTMSFAKIIQQTIILSLNDPQQSQDSMIKYLFFNMRYRILFLLILIILINNFYFFFNTH